MIIIFLKHLTSKVFDKNNILDNIEKKIRKYIKTE